MSIVANPVDDISVVDRNSLLGCINRRVWVGSYRLGAVLITVGLDLGQGTAELSIQNCGPSTLDDSSSSSQLLHRQLLVLELSLGRSRLRLELLKLLQSRLLHAAVPGLNINATATIR